MDTTSKPTAAAADQIDTLGEMQGRLPARQEMSDFDQQERHILECLGAAVVDVWSDLPRNIQRAIFEYAAAQQSYDTARLRTQLARFLHDHHD